MSQNHRDLAERFAQRLVELEPKGVLDVGCGSGFLLGRCAEHGIGSVGIEVTPPPAHELAPEATRLAADARRLPFASASFDWVTFRHVPHHLEHPREAFREAWRVARIGLLLAEPWFDPEMPSQREGRALDDWLKRQDRRRGMFHGDNLAAVELRELLPTEPARFRAETFSAARPHEMEELQERGRLASAGLELCNSEKDAWAQHLERARQGRATQNGTLIAWVWK